MDFNNTNPPKEPTATGPDSADAGSGAAPKLTKGGVAKRTFAPKAKVRRPPTTETKMEDSKKPERSGFKDRHDRRDSPRGSGRGRGGSSRGRGEVMVASGPFAMGPGGISSSFKRAQPIFSGKHGSGGGGGGGGEGVKHGGYGGSKGYGSINYDDETREEYDDDAEIMVHVEGSIDAVKTKTVDGEVTLSKEELHAEEVARQLSGLDLTEDKVALFNDSTFPAKSEIGMDEEKPEPKLMFFQLPSILPALSSGQDQASDPSIEGQVGKLIIRKSGRVQLQYGSLLLDVATGAECNFHQEAVVFDKENNEAIVLGPANYKFVCTPDIASLLSK